MLNIDSSTVIAISSAVVAVLAMIATFWQADIARKHNKLSVRPFMEHREERLHGEQIMIAIVNHGLGPAIYQSVFFNLSSSSDILSINDFHKYIALKLKPSKMQFRINTFQGKTVFPPEKEVQLLTFLLSEEDNENFEIIKGVLDQTTIHISYTSLYDEYFTYSEPLNNSDHKLPSTT
jgi:isopentenyl phosphate kinase